MDVAVIVGETWAEFCHQGVKIRVIKPGQRQRVGVIVLLPGHGKCIAFGTVGDPLAGFSHIGGHRFLREHSDFFDVPGAKSAAHGLIVRLSESRDSLSSSEVFRTELLRSLFAVYPRDTSGIRSS